MKEPRGALTKVAYLGLLIHLTAVVVKPPIASAQNEVPTAEQFQFALNTCAGGIDNKFSADLIGSVKSAYEGQRTTGLVSFTSSSKFLELFPASDRAAAYKLYTHCIVNILHGNVGAKPASGEPTPSPQSQNDDAVYANEKVIEPWALNIWNCDTGTTQIRP